MASQKTVQENIKRLKNMSKKFGNKDIPTRPEDISNLVDATIQKAKKLGWDMKRTPKQKTLRALKRAAIMACAASARAWKDSLETANALYTVADLDHRAKDAQTLYDYAARLNGSGDIIPANEMKDMFAPTSATNVYARPFTDLVHAAFKEACGRCRDFHLSHMIETSFCDTAEKAQEKEEIMVALNASSATPTPNWSDVVQKAHHDGAAHAIKQMDKIATQGASAGNTKAFERYAEVAEVHTDRSHMTQEERAKIMAQVTNRILRGEQQPLTLIRGGQTPGKEALKLAVG